MPWFSGWAAPIGSMADGLRHARWKPPTAEWGVQPAEGHLPYALTVSGSHWSTPCDPGGAPYGRMEYGRSRRTHSCFIVGVKGLNNT